MYIWTVYPFKFPLLSYNIAQDRPHYGYTSFFYSLWLVIVAYFLLVMRVATFVLRNKLYDRCDDWRMQFEAQQLFHY